ncbi:MAG: TetR/AcrR family transcriptional regulator [Tannerella sp.]|jgi:AcrR family transcriptional regulator|nr:TetR/AcrR family transcriptional regulator [Tannerella sp.]
MIKDDSYTEVQRKIVEAARKLFVKKGFKGTTVRDIATLSGTNVAMVNYYFRSKEKLFDYIFEEAFSILMKRIFSIMDADLSFFDLIRKWVSSYYDTLLKYPDLPIFVLTELAQNPDKLSETFKLKNPYQLYAKLAVRINEEEKKGTIRTFSLSNFFLNVISLSVFPFIAKPMVIQFLNLSEKEYLELLDNHGQFVADFIIKAIRTNDGEQSQTGIV